MSTPRPFNLSFAPEAWGQIGTLGGEDFRRVQEEMSRVVAQHAERHARGEQAGAGLGTALVGDLVLLYSVDDSQRTITCVRIARSLSPNGTT